MATQNHSSFVSAEQRKVSRNPFVFVLGSPRSGTTLLKRMLDAHPDLAITRETHWITRYYKQRIGLTHDGMTTKDLVSKLFEYHRLPHLGFEQKEIEQLISLEHPIPYTEFVSMLFDLYGKRRQKSLVGDKTPGYVRNIPLLHQLWPNAKFIHIIRDGREVCLSMLNWRLRDRTVGKFETWPDDSVSTIALWWKRLVLFGVEAGKTLPSKLYLEIRYDQLVEDPEHSCVKLCDFLGLIYNKSMLNFAEGRTKSETDLSANSAWLPPTKGLRDWRFEMVDDDCQRFEAIAGDFLEERGFARAFPNPNLKTKKQASWIYQRFTQDLSNRRLNLPQTW